MRGKGIGKALLIKLAQIAVAENCYGMRWQVLEWNEPALKFYDTLGAHVMDEWETMLLRGAALARLAHRQTRPRRAVWQANNPEAVLRNDEAKDHRRRSGRL